MVIKCVTEVRRSLGGYEQKVAFRFGTRHPPRILRASLPLPVAECRTHVTRQASGDGLDGGQWTSTRASSVDVERVEGAKSFESGGVGALLADDPPTDWPHIVISHSMSH